MLEETLVIVLKAKGHPASGKTHMLARGVQAIVDELELKSADVMITSFGRTDFGDHLEHLPEMLNRDHLDPNDVNVTMAVMPSGA